MDIITDDEDTDQNAEQLADTDGGRRIEGIHTEIFDNQAAAGIEDGVKEEYVSPVPKPSAAGNHQEYKNAKIPEGLIEEGGHMPLQAGGTLDLHRKGEETERRILQKKAVGFLIEIVAPSSDGLRQNKSRSDQIAKCEDVYFTPAAKDDRRQEACYDSAVDGDAALPYTKNGNEIILESIPGKNHIVNTRPDDAHRKHNE